jgi:hypothetical protein
MSNTLIVVGGVLIVLGVCTLAFLRGAPPERAAAVWVLGTWLAGVAGAMIFGRTDLPLIVLVVDGVLAIALLFISIQYASLWLGGAMLVQSSAFALHAWYLTEMPLDRNGYLLAISLLAYTVLVLLLGATLTRWVQRVRKRRETSRQPLLGAATAGPA